MPAEAEIVIEGHVMLDEFGDEGPYGDHTGYYNAVEPFPVFRISAITMRRDPIYLSTFTGRLPDEPSVLGEALNEVFAYGAKGKSAGVRVTYLFRTPQTPIFLLTIFAKNEKSNVTAKELGELLRLADILISSYGAPDE